VTFTDAIDEYLRDQQATGRINSENTLRAYRTTLLLHGEDSRHDPLESDREDVRLTLARWGHPNSRGRGHSVLRSFYDWLQTEGYRETNPARQVRAVKARPASVYRLTRSESCALIDACQTLTERRVILIGLCTGARVNELIHLQPRHFQREGWVWFSPDIAKRKVERWVPVLPDLEPVIQTLPTNPGHYVLAGYRKGARQRDPLKALSAPTVARTVRAVAQRAGIAAALTPHSMRHAFGDHIARACGLRVAQALMGHASVGTTERVYTSRPGLDELAGAVEGLRYGGRLERFEAQMQATGNNLLLPIDRVSEVSYGVPRD
jgi:integrase/recombinase XerD